MKQLLDHIKQSIYGPAYYESLLSRPFSFSWKYYSALALSVALLLTIVSSISLVPQVNQAVRDFPEKFFAYYPDELAVHIDKGIVSSNALEPYFLPIPAELKGDLTPKSGMESLVVIDTKTPFSATQFKEYKVGAWLGRDQLAIADKNGGIRIEPLTGQMNLTINKGTLRSFEQNLQPFYKFAAPIVVLVVFASILIGLGINFIYLIFGAVLIFFLGRLLKQRWSYGAAYRIGLHAITLPLLLSTLLSLLGLSAITFSLLFSTVMLAVIFVNFKDAASSATPLAPAAAPKT